MFTERELPRDLHELRDALVPRGLVIDCAREFGAMPADWGYEIALFTDSISPATYPDAWIPPDASPALRRLADHDLSIGLPGDGGVTWTVQTTPPLVIVKPRLEGAPEDFRDFLVAEALLQISLGHPEEPIGFFEDHYPALQEAVGGNPEIALRLAIALTEGWRGLETRDHFSSWAESFTRLHAAWLDAGQRIADRVDALPRLLADGTLSFVDAADLACSAIKHDLDLSSPFAALDVDAYYHQGAAFAVRWAAETVDDPDPPLG